MDEHIDRHGLEVLGRPECLRLLGQAKLGRIALSIDALPTVLPVNFVLDGDRVVLRTGEGSKLDAALAGAVVAFEVDEVDPIYHEGWSVVVTGVAHPVIDQDEVDRLDALPLHPWSIDADRFLVIETHMISGRRLTHRTAGVHPLPH